MSDAATIEDWFYASLFMLVLAAVALIKVYYLGPDALIFYAVPSVFLIISVPILGNCVLVKIKSKFKF
jgi:hypothetical protein